MGMIMQLGSYALNEGDQAAVAWLRSLPSRLLKAEQPSQLPLAAAMAAGVADQQRRKTNARKGMARKIDRSELLAELKGVLADQDYKAAKKLIKATEIFDKVIDMKVGTNSVMELMGHVAVQSSKSGSREKPYYIARCSVCPFFLACKQHMVADDEFNEWFELPSQHALARCMGSQEPCFDDDESAEARMPNVGTSAAASSAAASTSSSAASASASVSASVATEAARRPHVRPEQQAGAVPDSQSTTAAGFAAAAAAASSPSAAAAVPTLQELLASLTKDGGGAQAQTLLQQLVGSAMGGTQANTGMECAVGQGAQFTAPGGATTAEAATGGAFAAVAAAAAKQKVTGPLGDAVPRKRFTVDEAVQQPQELDDSNDDDEGTDIMDPIMEPSAAEAEEVAEKMRAAEQVRCTLFVRARS